MSLLELYSISEMARTRGDPTWWVLDWAAQQTLPNGEPKPFTLDQAFREYQRAGGQSEKGAFTRIFRFLVGHGRDAPKLKWRAPKYEVSERRPIAVVRYGRRGKGGQFEYIWGLDGPLRQPQPMPNPDAADDEPDAIGDALDRLEKGLGRPALKAAMDRWRRMPTMAALSADIKGLKPRFQMDALLVGSQHLIDSGQADEEDIEDAEAGLPPAAQSMDPEPTPSTPFTVGKRRTDLFRTGQAAAVRSQATAEPDPGEEWGDADSEKTDPDAVSPFADDFESGVQPDEAPDDEGEPEPEEAESEEGPAAGYPDWSPTPDDEGSEEEQAMFRLIADHGIEPDDPLWSQIAQAADETELRSYVRRTLRAKREAWEDAMAVGRFGLESAFEPPEDDGDLPGGDESEAESEEGPTDEPEYEDEPEDGDGEQDSFGDAGGYPEWLPAKDETGTKAESAMYDILEELGQYPGFEEFNESDPIFAEMREAAGVTDAYRIITNRGVPKRFQSKFIAVARAIFTNDGKDPETGRPLAEGLARECDDEVPDPSKRGPVGVGRLLPLYGMDEGPNIDPVDFAPRSGLARIIRATRR